MNDPTDRPVMSTLKLEPIPRSHLFREAIHDSADQTIQLWEDLDILETGNDQTTQLWEDLDILETGNDRTTQLREDFDILETGNDQTTQL